MPIAGRNDVRNFEAGTLLVGAGAILLLISLFLEWYQPGIDAWEIFEVWDLVLALLALGALAATASRLGFGPQRPAIWVLGPALAALVITLYNILDPPPLITSAIDGDPSTGLWLALGASLLMTAGAVMSVARISVAFSAAGHGAGGPVGPHHGADPDPYVAGPAGPATPPARGRRFMRGPNEPGVADPVDPVGGPADPAAPGAVPPTEPTRRL